VILELNLPSYRLKAAQQWQKEKQEPPETSLPERTIDESLENKFARVTLGSCPSRIDNLSVRAQTKLVGYTARNFAPQLAAPLRCAPSPKKL